MNTAELVSDRVAIYRAAVAGSRTRARRAWAAAARDWAARIR